MHQQSRVMTIPAILSVRHRAPAAAAAGVDWSQWLNYAWVFKGATSLATSYVDLINGQTLAAGAAPTWNATDGWILNGSSWMTTGLSVATKSWSAIVRFSGQSGNGCLFGAQNDSTAPYQSFVIYPNYGGTIYYRNYGQATSANGSTAGTMAITPSKGYLNGTPDGNLSSQADYSLPTIYLGAYHSNSPNSAQSKIAAKIQFFGIRTSAWTDQEVSDLTTIVNAL